MTTSLIGSSDQRRIWSEMEAENSI